jgi:FtsP/CotA-like multicopper oxidase with cupredoxin domain
VITLGSHADVVYTMTLDSYVGFWAGRLGQVWTLNGQAFPNTPAYVVAPGQQVQIHLVNAGGAVHTMHLHGHSFAMLTRNGQPLTGSSVVLDTLLVGPKETYDIAFAADNPGLWMFHCHNLVHANWGMDMMLVYPNIATPYTIGPASGNFPD